MICNGDCNTLIGLQYIIILICSIAFCIEIYQRWSFYLIVSRVTYKDHCAESCMKVMQYSRFQDVDIFSGFHLLVYLLIQPIFMAALIDVDLCKR